MCACVCAASEGRLVGPPRNLTYQARMTAACYLNAYVHVCVRRLLANIRVYFCLDASVYVRAFAV